MPDVQNNITPPAGPFRFPAANFKLIGVVALLLFVLFATWFSKDPQPKLTTSRDPLVTPTTQQAAQRAQADLAKQIEAASVLAKRAEAAKAQADLDVAKAGAAMPPAGSVAQPQQYYAPQMQAARRESNVALSFRENQRGVSTAGNTPSPELTDVRALIDAEKKELAGMMENLPVKRQPVSPSAPPAFTDPQPEPVAAKRLIPPDLQQSTGQKYRLFEGTTIETVLTNRLNGSFAGPVNVLVTTDVYSHDHLKLLIPQGTRIIGEAQRVGTQGQQRLAVVFHRIIMPDGYSESLDQFTGLNQIGETGLKDKVDNHLLSVLGSSVALGLISGFTIYGTRGIYDADGIDQYRQGVATSLGQSSRTILANSINRIPTITIREGHRVKVYIRQDLELPAYANHKVRSDI